jgi:methionyl-tRNA formyltransferase
MRIVLMGDGEWAADSVLRLGDEGHTVAAAVVRARPTGRRLADAARALGARVLQPRDVSSREFLAEIAALQPDLLLSVAYDRILKRPLLALPRCGSVNFHAGKLPAYRGRNVVNWAIINGEEEIGLTAHQIDEGIDTGAILLQRTLPIRWSDTYADVLRAVVRAMPDLVASTVRGLAEGSLTAVAQPAAGTYYGGRIEGDEWLDWRDSSRDLYNKIRGITRPGPGARTILDGGPVIIWHAEYDPAWPQYRATPGQVVGRTASGSAVIKSGDSTLLVHEIETEGQPARPPAWPLGTRLGVNLTAALEALSARVSQLERQREGSIHA